MDSTLTHWAQLVLEHQAHAVCAFIIEQAMNMNASSKLISVLHKSSKHHKQ